jgi:pyridoxamine 5'-phosphate oxidase
MSILDENPNKIFNNIKELLLIGAKDRKHAFHTPVFSNNNKDNLVNSRVVVLRKFDEKALKLNFHTDMRSLKIINLQDNYNSFFVFYDPKIKIQLRITTKSIINNRNKVAESSWGETRLFSRKCYLTTKAPSSATKIPEDGIPLHLRGVNPSKDESEKGYENFAVIENIIINIDWLYLDFSGHRRLNINLINKDTLFEWIIP